MSLSGGKDAEEFVRELRAALDEAESAMLSNRSSMLSLKAGYDAAMKELDELRSQTKQQNELFDKLVAQATQQKEMTLSLQRQLTYATSSLSELQVTKAKLVEAHNECKAYAIKIQSLERIIASQRSEIDVLRQSAPLL